ncbi:MAG: glycosyltransferase family 4 protein [Candidatus Dojkabacteria bacterium]
MVFAKLKSIVKLIINAKVSLNRRYKYNPLLSVIITKNSEAIDLSKQTFADFELVRDVNLAKGKYIVFLEEGAKLDPTFFEKCLLKLEIEGIDLVYCGRNAEGIGEDLNLDRNRIPSSAVHKRPASLVNAKAVSWSYWNELLKRGYRSGFIGEDLLYSPESKKKIEEAEPAPFSKKEIRRISRRHRQEIYRLFPLANLGAENLKLDKKVNNVAVALPYPRYGGGERIFYLVAKSLQEEGWKFNLICRGTTETNVPDRYEDFRRVGADIWLQEYLVGRKRNYYALYRYLVSSRRISSLVITGNDSLYHCLPKLKQKFAELQIIDQQYNQVEYVNQNLRYKRYIDYTVSDNLAVLNFLKENGNNYSQMEQIAPGLDIQDQFNHKNYPEQLENKEQSGKFRVIFVGRWSKEKGTFFFLDVAKEFRERDDIEFVLVGYGEAEQKLREKVEQDETASIVNFHGFTDNSAPLLAGSHVLVLPSHFEGYPAVIMEAMAMGLPVIASNVGGISEQIDHEENGYVIDEFDPTIYAKRLDELMGNKDKYESFSESARRKAENIFSIEKTVSSYENIFRLSLDNKNR